MTGPSGIALDAAYVYWTDANTAGITTAGNGIYKVKIDGSAKAVLVATDPGFPSGNIAVDSTNIYWTNASSLMTVPKTGGTPTTLVTGITSPAGVAVDP